MLEYGYSASADTLRKFKEERHDAPATVDDSISYADWLQANAKTFSLESYREFASYIRDLADVLPVTEKLVEMPSFDDWVPLAGGIVSFFVCVFFLIEITNN